MLSFVTLVSGYRVIVVEDLHPVIVVEDFDFLSHILMGNAVVMLVLPQADMGILHHSADFDAHQLVRKFRERQKTAALQGLKLLPAAFLTPECVFIVAPDQRYKCLVEAIQGQKDFCEARYRSADRPV